MLEKIMEKQNQIEKKINEIGYFLNWLKAVITQIKEHLGHISHFIWDHIFPADENET